MSELNPNATTMLSLLFMIPRERGSKAWELISAQHRQHDLGQFLKPLVKHAAEGHRPTLRVLAGEVLDSFSNLEEDALAAVGGVLAPGSDNPDIGRVWARELTRAALAVLHELLPGTLQERAAAW